MIFEEGSVHGTPPSTSNLSLPAPPGFHRCSDNAITRHRNVCPATQAVRESDCGVDSVSSFIHAPSHSTPCQVFRWHAQHSINRSMTGYQTHPPPPSNTGRVKTCPIKFSTTHEPAGTLSRICEDLVVPVREDSCVIVISNFAKRQRITLISEEAR